MDEYENSSLQLQRLADRSKKLIHRHQLAEAEKEIRHFMELFPDSAIPHNLYGILCEIRKEHSCAMKHFRAAMALEPTDRASAYNLELFGTHSEKRIPAYSDKDLGIFRQLAQKVSFWHEAV